MENVLVTVLVAGAVILYFWLLKKTEKGGGCDFSTDDMVEGQVIEEMEDTAPSEEVFEGSPPFLAVLRTFEEEGRWQRELQSEVYSLWVRSLCLTDTTTGVSLDLWRAYSPGPRDMYSCAEDVWTPEEAEAFWEKWVEIENSEAELGRLATRKAKREALVAIYGEE